MQLGYSNTNVRDTLLISVKKDAISLICLRLGRTPDRFPEALEVVADNITKAAITQLNSEGLKTEMTDISRYDYVEDIYEQWIPWIDNWQSQSEAGNRKRLRML